MAKWVDFKTVREHLDFHDMLAHYGLEEHGEGDQIKIICPFHNDHKPSCGINMVKQVYNCFACDAGGNALDFVAHMEGHDPDKPVELRKAAMAAADIFGIDAALERPVSGNAKAKAVPKAKTKAVPKKKVAQKPVTVANDNAEVDAEPVEQENEKPANQPLTFALQLEPKHEYVDARGFDPALIKSFGIGHANKGMMKGRICFPIHNAEGELIAYSGRWADEELPEDIARYLLPKGFEKNKVLFNLNRLIEKREAGEDIDTVVIVEGFWSVLRLHRENIPCVSTFGDSVSEAQADLLAQHGFKHVILIFDGDEGGHTGTKTSLPILAERLFVKTVALDDGVKPDSMSEELVDALPRFA